MAAKTCNCRGSKQYTVTPGNGGASFTVKSEIEAKAAARRTGGTYKLK